MITQKGLVVHLNNYQANTIDENRNLFLFVRELVLTKIEEICALYNEPMDSVLLNYESTFVKQGNCWIYELDFLPEHAINEVNFSIQSYIQESVTAFIMGRKSGHGFTKMNFNLTMYQSSRFMITYELFKQ